MVACREDRTVGALRLPSYVTRLWLLDSIVDGILHDGDPWGVAVSDAANLSGPPAHIERCTLFGSSRYLKVDLASESIFMGTVEVDDGVIDIIGVEISQA